MDGTLDAVKHMITHGVYQDNVCQMTHAQLCFVLDIADI